MVQGENSKPSVSFPAKPPVGCCETAEQELFFSLTQFFWRGFCGVQRWEAGSRRRSTTWDEATRKYIRGRFQWVLWWWWWRNQLLSQEKTVGNISGIVTLWTLCWVKLPFFWGLSWPRGRGSVLVTRHLMKQIILVAVMRRTVLEKLFVGRN